MTRAIICERCHVEERSDGGEITAYCCVEWEGQSDELVLSACASVLPNRGHILALCGACGTGKGKRPKLMWLLVCLVCKV